jgi:hypothetical protein
VKWLHSNAEPLDKQPCAAAVLSCILCHRALLVVALRASYLRTLRQHLQCGMQAGIGSRHLSTLPVIGVCMFTAVWAQPGTRGAAAAASWTQTK